MWRGERHGIQEKERGEKEKDQRLILVLCTLISHLGTLTVSTISAIE